VILGQALAGLFLAVLVAAPISSAGQTVDTATGSIVGVVTFTTDPSQLRYRTVTVLAELVGTRRTDNITVLDARVEKGVRLNGTHRLAGFIDVFNCLNANPEQNMIWSSESSFLRPVSIVSPRIARVGVKFDW
jgi:hypothetical protein